MAQPGSLILVTGASGFLGSHVVHQLLESGYRVRGIVRPSKVVAVQQGYAHYGDKFQAAGIDDLISGDFTTALQGVGGVIHVAAPLPGRMSALDALEASIQGSLNVIQQAEQAGVKHFTYVSSIAAVRDPSRSALTDQTWNPVTKEAALNQNADEWVVYAAEKTLSERAVWDFVDKHHHIELLTVNPTFFYGPFAPGWTNPTASLAALSTNEFIYNFLNPNGPVRVGSGWVDVRDVARALVLGLTAPPTSQVGRKRIILTGEWFDWKDAADYIAEARPELKDRLSAQAKSAPPAQQPNIDTARSQEVLGLKMTPWKSSLLNAVDSLVALEKEWESKGLKPN